MVPELKSTAAMLPRTSTCVGCVCVCLSVCLCLCLCLCVCVCACLSGGVSLFLGGYPLQISRPRPEAIGVRVLGQGDLAAGALPGLLQAAAALRGGVGFRWLPLALRGLPLPAPPALARPACAVCLF